MAISNQSQGSIAVLTRILELCVGANEVENIPDLYTEGSTKKHSVKGKGVADNIVFGESELVEATTTKYFATGGSRSSSTQTD